MVFQTVTLHDNPWECDCHLRPVRDLVVHGGLLEGAPPPSCHAPASVADAAWPRLESSVFACAPEVRVGRPRDTAGTTELECWVTGDPVPGVRWGPWPGV